MMQVVVLHIRKLEKRKADVTLKSHKCSEDSKSCGNHGVRTSLAIYFHVTSLSPQQSKNMDETSQ